MKRSILLIVGIAALALNAPSFGAVTCPNEFEEPSNALGPIYAYFGGVTSWGTTPSAMTIFSGNSLEVWANLVDDQFTVAGFAVGTFGIGPPNLALPPNADTFSITIQSPTNGTLSFKATLREDDNGDGIINVNGPDDQWEAPTIILSPGTNVYNIPYALFEDLNPGDGDDVQNFNTTGKLAYFLTFESRDSYPGGQIIGPVSFLIDHVGLYSGFQTLPPTSIPGDIDGDGHVNVADLLAVINGWGACPVPPASCPGDVAPQPGDGIVNVGDLLMVINHWG